MLHSVSSVLEYVRSAFQNPVSSGIGLTAIGGAVFYELKSVPGRALYFLEKMFVSSITIDSTTDSFEEFDRWISKKLSHRFNKSLQILPSQNYDEGDYLSHSIGTFYFMDGLRVIKARRKREKTNGEYDGKPLVMDSISISTLSFTNSYFKSLASEILNRKQYVEKFVYVLKNGYWCKKEKISEYNKRNIIMKDGLFDDITYDIKKFIDSKDWYMEMGIPYHRGYLLSGPPGTGKTSFGIAVASKLSLNLYVINLESVSSDEAFVEEVLNTQKNSLIVIEDIDCCEATNTRTGNDSPRSKTGVSMTALLNVLDGVYTPSGAIFILTTNYPERIDSALIRPGRCDRHIIFEAFSGKDQGRLWNYYYKDGNFDNYLPFPITPAQAQAAFLRHPGNRLDAMNDLSNEKDVL